MGKERTTFVRQRIKGDDIYCYTIPKRVMHTCKPVKSCRTRNEVYRERIIPREDGGMT